MDVFVAMLRENSFYLLAIGAGAGILLILRAFGLFAHWHLTWGAGDHGVSGSGGAGDGDCGGGD